MVSILPVILAGGVGSRLWPLSRELYPKQLLQLTGDTTLLQTTVLRVAGLKNALPPIIIVRDEHQFVAKRQIDELGEIGQYSILLEPMEKNTAPAICGAAYFCKKEYDEGPIMLVLPVDHIITREEDFHKAVEGACQLAGQRKIVTFGIEPTHPETEYGYIEHGKDNTVVSFKEKPDFETAKKYFESGKYLWNSGMFVFTVPTFLQELRKYAPDIVRSMGRAVESGSHEGVFFRFGAAQMSQCASISIDYVLMEKTDRAVVVAANLGWNDIGSWKTLWEILGKDEDGNVVHGDVIVEGSRNCLIRSENVLVSAFGLEDTLVIEADDAVLVAPLSKSQDVRKIVTQLKKRERSEYATHRTVHRHWGSYTIVDEQDRLQIKRIIIDPFSALPSQTHHHLCQHLVVITGAAMVTHGNETFLLSEKESTCIPAGVTHRLENPGVTPLEIIGIQIVSSSG